MKPTGIVRDPVYLMHEMGAYHPESPQRLEVIYSMLDERGSGLNLFHVPIRNATIDEIAFVHDVRYINQIAATAGKEDTFLDPDTSACPYSWEAASCAVGGILNLIDAVFDGVVRNGFALVRPPGHHAERRRAMGFCLFNNIAVAARYAIARYGIERIAIVDWDLHHGNGTQNAFYEDPKVLFLSIHQFPHYPGTGGVREAGYGAGEGYTINVPLGSGAGDAEYLTTFYMLVAPVLEAYRPQLILVSAGFDAHHNDPLGGMSLTEDGYEQMTKILMHLAAECCQNKLVLSLEGGYNLNALRESVGRVVHTLVTYDPDKDNVPPQPSFEILSTSFKNRLRDILNFHKKYWTSLNSF